MADIEKKQYLVISALGSDRPGLVDQLSRTLFDSSCNIEDSRMAVLGGEFSLILLVSGDWNNIAKVEQQIPRLQQTLGLVMTSRRTEERAPQPNLLPYSIDVVSIDHPGIVYHLANFLSRRQINIEDMTTSTYSAPHTGTPMFSVHMAIEIPADNPIATLRDEFLDFCDDFNLDAVMEPFKG